eukprot:349622-Chlamydomonas_euryale.AAC.4
MEGNGHARARRKRGRLSAVIWRAPAAGRVGASRGADLPRASRRANASRARCPLQGLPDSQVARADPRRPSQSLPPQPARSSRHFRAHRHEARRRGGAGRRRSPLPARVKILGGGPLARQQLPLTCAAAAPVPRLMTDQRGPARAAQRVDMPPTCASTMATGTPG